MLVLTRRIGERIIIGDNIEIEVLNTTKGQASIGITAPRDICIMRQEVLERKRKSSNDETNLLTLG